MSRRHALTLLLAPLLATALTGCGGEEDDPFAAYCAEVEAQQKPLSEALAGGGPTALIQALPSFEELEAKAPADITDEWRVVTRGIEGLVETLDEAGVDPASYDRENPPAGVTKEQQDAIDAASRRLTAPESVAALEGVQQQARDVCKMPLSM
jgi:hypothetical protein